MTNKANYVRVSTTHQSTARQENVFTEGKTFIDKVSGSIPFSERPEASKLLKAIKSGIINHLSVKDVTRLGRNSLDIINTVDLLKNAGCQLVVKDLGLSLFLENGKVNFAFELILSVMATLAEQERLTMLERQREGIEIAKIQGKYNRIGKTAVTDTVTLSRHEDIQELLLDGKSLRKIAQLTKKSLGTVQKIKKIMTTKNML